jgi:hypothetical protein
MRYPGSEKLEIIRLVEHSHLPARRTGDSFRAKLAVALEERSFDIVLGRLNSEHLAST